jgi:peptide/nickel transport system substrate-binding protein
MRLARLKSAAVVAALLTGLSAPAAGNGVLKLVAETDLKSLDPIWTTAGVTATHGFLIYDQLFAQDTKGLVKPQMVESWKASADGLIWTFVLRPGLQWHDGTPVTAKDVAPSVKRWGARIASGQVLFTRVGDVAAVDERTFEIRLKDIFGPMVEMLGASAQPLLVMREKEARTDPFQQVQETVGSGPFIFERDKWVPGSRVVYRKNPGYVPRTEAPDGTTGAKIPKLDGIEWVVIPDPATSVQAMIRGEVDFLEIAPTDLIPLLEKDPNIVVRVINKAGSRAVLRPNHLVAPTNNAKFRQALLYAMNQKEVLGAMIGNDSLEKECWAVFSCGFPLESSAGVGAFATPSAANIETAKRLLKEAGYNGEPVVMMNPKDQAMISAMTTMTGQLLQKAGINVDMQNVDWGTLVGRRALKDDPKTSRAGWHFFQTTGVAPLAADPLTANTAATPCDGRNWFGWPCDETLEAMRQKFISLTSDAERKKQADIFQERFFEVVPYVPVGMFFQKAAWRSNVEGVLDNLLAVFWNVTKK